MVATYHYDAKAPPAGVGPPRPLGPEGSVVAPGVRATTAWRGVWTSVEGELEVCECADFDGGRKRKAVCLGLHSGCRSQVVRRPLLVYLLNSLFSSSIPSTLPSEKKSTHLS